MNILIICSGKKNRSSLLEKHFTNKYINNDYKSGVIDAFNESTSDTHFLTLKDLEWCNYIVFCELSVREKMIKEFRSSMEYVGELNSDFIIEAENCLERILKK